MKVEIRRLKHKTFLLLLAETLEENKALDEVLGDPMKKGDCFKVTGEVTCDDSFNAYVRFKK